MLTYLIPLIVLVATTILGNLTKLPVRFRPYLAVAAGVALQLFANGGLVDGFQVQDIVEGVILGLTAVGLYSGTKNVVQEHRARSAR